MPVAYSYIRFSSTRQRQGASEQRQEETPEPWCLANGYTLDVTLRLRDLGRSGYKGHHVSKGALGAFLELVRGGKIARGSVLLVEHLDRLTRQDPLTGMELILDLIKAGIDVVTLMDGERYNRDRLSSDLGAQIKLQFVLFQSHMESKTKSARNGDRWVRKRAQAREGERVILRAPTWLDPATLEVREDRAAIIRMIYTLAAGGEGAQHIARSLNEQGIRPTGRAKAWEANMVRYLLRTRTVLGEYQPCRGVEGGKVAEGPAVPDYYPAIIDKALFDKVQHTIASRKRAGVRGRSDPNKNLFPRLIRDLRDGGTWHFNEFTVRRSVGKEKTPTSFHYARLISSNARAGTTPALALDYRGFESAFIRFVREVDVLALFKTEDAEAQRVELAGCLAKLDDLNEQVAIASSYFKSEKGGAKARFAGMIAEAESERSIELARIETLRANLTTAESRVFEDLRAMLDGPESRAQVAGAIRMLIDRISILVVPTGKGRGNKNEYLLWAEVRFHNGRTRFYLTNHDGTAGATVGGRAFTNVDGDRKDIPERRRAVLASIIAQASPTWRPRLEAWLATQSTG